MTNGKNALTAIAICVTILVTFTGYVVANDVGSRARDEKLGDRVSTNESSVQSIKTDLAWLKQDAMEQKATNKENFKEIKELLKDIKG